MVVLETTVVASYLFGVKPHIEPLRAFWNKAARTGTRVVSPAIWETEIAAVIQGAFGAGVISERYGLSYLRRAGRLSIESISTATLCEAAFLRSIAERTSVRDMLFLELARRHDVSLVTLDVDLLTRFPRIAKLP